MPTKKPPLPKLSKAKAKNNRPKIFMYISSTNEITYTKNLDAAIPTWHTIPLKTVIKALDEILGL